MRDAVAHGGRPLLATELVGRGRELAVLESAWKDACAGRGGLVAVTGQAGIGKSRLTEELARLVDESGGRVLRGRAVPGPTPVAFRPIAEAVAGAVRAGLVIDDEGLRPFRPTLARFVPAWRDADQVADDTIVVVAEGVLCLLRAAAGAHGCLLLVEDVHWSDPETIAILEYLADHAPGEPVLCVVTVRDEQPSSGLDLVRALAARRAIEVVALDRLADADVEPLLASCFAGEVAGSDVRALVARADGIPFLIEELLGVAAAAGALHRDGGSWHLAPGADRLVPLTFAESVRRRVAGLGRDAEVVLGVAAILGRRFERDLLIATSGLAAVEVDAAIRDAIGAQLLAVDGDEGFRFRHALTRDAVLAEMLPSDRVHWSDAAVRSLEAHRPGLPGPACELAADLAERAGHRERAAGLLVTAAGRSAHAGASATAVAILERARRLTADAALLDVIDVELIELLGTIGELDRALELGVGVLARPAAAGWAAEIHLRLARAAIAARRWPIAAEHVAAARQHAELLDDDVLQARVDVVDAHVQLLRDPARAVELARRAVATAAPASQPDTAREALGLIGRVERAYDLRAAEDTFRRALELAEAQGSRPARLDALHELATVELLRDGRTDALEAARRLADELGAPATAAILDVQIGAGWSIRDDPEPGVEVCGRAAERAHRFRLDEVQAAALAFEAACHARAGRREEFDRCVAEARQLDADGPELRFNLAFARAQLCLITDDRDGAIAALTASTVDACEAVGVQATGPNAGLLALLTFANDDPTTAAKWLDQLPVHVVARGWGRYAEAALRGRSGDHTAAVGCVELGDRELARFAWYRHVGRRHLAEAAITDGWGEPVAWLTEALSFFDGRGEPSLASACRSLLRRAGAPVPRRRVVAPADGRWRALGATAREAEVLELLALGLTNREIAARLYMSHRTVERHVANLTVKTGVAGRTELVALAARTS